MKWSPSDALGLGLNYISQVSGIPGRDILSEFSKLIYKLNTKHNESDILSQNLLALMFNLFEHIYTSPENSSRLIILNEYTQTRILDWGCGSGFFSINLALEGKDVTCFDINPACMDFIEYAAKELNISNRINFYGKSMEYTSFTDIVCINVIDHIENPFYILKEFINKLETGRNLFIYAHFSEDGFHEFTGNARPLQELLSSELSFNFENSNSFLDIWTKSINTNIIWGHVEIAEDELLLCKVQIFPGSWITLDNNNIYTIKSNSMMLLNSTFTENVFAIYKAIKQNRHTVNYLIKLFSHLKKTDIIECIQSLRRRNIIILSIQ